jgi:2-keto-3-deoxy-L-rhamnonate aldolase RhmA
MCGKRIKEKLAAGQTVFGTFFQYTTNPAIVEMLPGTGLDFVVVNAEHNALSFADFMPLSYALRDKGIACLLRVHSRDTEDVAKACDAFADGVVLPYVEDVAQAKRLVAAAKYRPLKGVALERVLAGGPWPSEKTREYIEKKCENTLCCPMIESVKSVENLDAICSIPGIDAVFVGPNDLTVSMGIPEERDNPEFVAIMQRIIDTAARHGIAAGGHFSQLSHAQRIIAQGARFIPFSSDARVIQKGIPEFLGQLGAASAKRSAQVHI